MVLLTAMTVKIFEFQKINMVDGRHFENVKSAYLCNLLTDLHEIQHRNAYWSPAPCNFRQSYVSENCYLENLKTA